MPANLLINRKFHHSPKLLLDFMLYILDTDHISLFQRGNPVVRERLITVAMDERATTVISLSEQFLGWWNEIARAKNEADAARSFQYLLETVRFYQSLPVLSYDSAAVTEFERLRRARVRIGTQDLRIAAIAVSRSATIVTRNARDFRQVPGLQVVDWSVSAA